MIDYVVVPRPDYEDILKATKEQTGKNAPLLSNEVAPQIRSISGSGNPERERHLKEIVQELGELAPTITISFMDYYMEATSQSGSYRIGYDGETVYFESASSIDIGFVPVGTTVYVRVDGGSYFDYADATNCAVDFDWDEYAYRVVPTAENASVKLCDAG